MDFISVLRVTATKVPQFLESHESNVDYVEFILRIIWNSRCTYVDSIKSAKWSVVHIDSMWSPCGVHVEFMWSPPEISGVHLESIWSASGVHQESPESRSWPSIRRKNCIEWDLNSEPVGFPTATITVEPSDHIYTSKSELQVGLGTGTKKPTIIKSRLSWVRVQCWILAHHDILRTCTTVLQVFHGYYNMVSIIFYCFGHCFFSSFIIVFAVSSLCHGVTQLNMAVPAARTSLVLTFIIPHPCTVSNIYKTNNSIVF